MHVRLAEDNFMDRYLNSFFIPLPFLCFLFWCSFWWMSDYIFTKKKSLGPPSPPKNYLNYFLFLLLVTISLFLLLNIFYLTVLWSTEGPLLVDY